MICQGVVKIRRGGEEEETDGPATTTVMSEATGRKAIMRRQKKRKSMGELALPCTRSGLERLVEGEGWRLETGVEGGTEGIRKQTSPPTPVATVAKEDSWSKTASKKEDEEEKEWGDHSRKERSSSFVVPPSALCQSAAPTGTATVGVRGREGGKNATSSFFPSSPSSKKKKKRAGL